MGKLVRGADGLPADEVGEWVEEKHFDITQYVKLSHGARRQFLGPGKAGATYIDLFCGLGQARIRESSRIVDGAAIAAWRVADGQGSPFSAMYIADKDPTRRQHCAKRIPGRNKQGDIDRDELVRWIETVRRACSELGRQKVGDHSLGALMSHAPIGKDGVWPCEPVRDALERIQADDMSRGITMGLFNSRGAHWRGKGGDQERELAEPYRKWMNALQCSHPFVVSSILKPMFDTYERHAEIHDSEDEIQRRIRH
jgi:hypothetical protein